MRKIHIQNTRFSFVFTGNYRIQLTRIKNNTGIKKNRENSLFLCILRGEMKTVSIK